MKIIKKISEIEKILGSIRVSAKSVGLVLTMGNIHNGHLSLIKEAIKNNDFVITSIFINPIQFNNEDDFNSYPKTLQEDIYKIKSSNCDLLFLPTINEFYPEGLIKTKTVTNYRKILCDLNRPGHFDGVTTVVNKFFNIIKPNNSYFGEKDFQQMKIISELAKINKNNVNIVSCPSVRDIYGMSLSSRNSKFNSKQLEIFIKLAKEIYTLLNNIKQNKNNINLFDFKKNLLKINIDKIDYVEIRGEKNLETTKNIKHARLFIALYIDEIRIIDNFKLY